MRIKYLGHSGFLIDNEVLIDPFIRENPIINSVNNNNKNKFRIEDIKCKIICVSHDHSDHIGDTVEIAKHNNATVVCVHELSQSLAIQGVNTRGMNIG